MWLLYQSNTASCHINDDISFPLVMISHESLNCNINILKIWLYVHIMSTFEVNAKAFLRNVKTGKDEKVRTSLKSGKYPDVSEQGSWRRAENCKKVAKEMRTKLSRPVNVKDYNGF